MATSRFGAEREARRRELLGTLVRRETRLQVGGPPCAYPPPPPPMPPLGPSPPPRTRPPSTLCAPG